MIDFVMNIGIHIKELIGANPTMAYFWIFLFMTIESTFVPLPSEVVLPPAGYFVSKGDLNMFLCIVAGTLGSVFGALINYLIGRFLGEKVVEKLIGKKYNGICSNYFKKNGDATIFFSRLLFGVRHYISLPAGVYKMNIGKFILYTFLGALVWVVFLLYFGFYVGENEALLKEYKYIFFAAVIAIIILGFTIKHFWDKKFKKDNEVCCKK